MVLPIPLVRLHVEKRVPTGKLHSNHILFTHIALNILVLNRTPPLVALRFSSTLVIGFVLLGTRKVGK